MKNNNLEIVKFTKESMLIRFVGFSLLGFALSPYFFAVSVGVVGEWVDLGRKLRKLNSKQY